tara:strand:+ start:1336 stop:1512 length:177 start_codon:yes stop_codon:yes gene_type:complete
MEWNKKILETILAFLYLTAMVYLLSGCGSSHSIPSEVTITPIKDTEVKRDGVLVYPYK